MNNAGRLRDPIIIYSESEAAPNKSGQRIKSYVYAFATRAETSFLSASEDLTNRIEFAEKTLRFKVRFRMSAYNERQLIYFRNDFYNIRGIDHDRERKYIILTADRIIKTALTIYNENQQPISQIDLENDTIDLETITIQL